MHPPPNAPPPRATYATRGSGTTQRSSSSSTQRPDDHNERQPVRDTAPRPATHHERQREPRVRFTPSTRGPGSGSESTVRPSPSSSAVRPTTPAPSAAPAPTPGHDAPRSTLEFDFHFDTNRVGIRYRPAPPRAAAHPVPEGSLDPVMEGAARSSPENTVHPSHQSAGPSSPPPRPRSAAQAPTPPRQSAGPSGPSHSRPVPQAVTPRYTHSSSNPPAFSRGPGSESTASSSSKGTVRPSRQIAGPSIPPPSPRSAVRAVQPSYIHSSSNPPAFARGPGSESTASSSSDSTGRPAHNRRSANDRAPSSHSSVLSDRPPPVPPKDIHTSVHPQALVRSQSDWDGRTIHPMHNVAGPSRHAPSAHDPAPPGPDYLYSSVQPATFARSDTSSDDGTIRPDSDLIVRQADPPESLESYDGYTGHLSRTKGARTAPLPPPRIVLQSPTPPESVLERLQLRDLPVEDGTDVSVPLSGSYYSSGYTGAGPDGSYVHSGFSDSPAGSGAMVPTGATATSQSLVPRSAPYNSAQALVHRPVPSNSGHALVPRPAPRNSGPRVRSFVGSWVEEQSVVAADQSFATDRPVSYGPSDHRGSAPPPFHLHPLREKYAFMPYDYFCAAVSGTLPPWLLYVVFNRYWRAPELSTVPHDPGAHLSTILPSFEILSVAWIQLCSLCSGGDPEVVAAMADHLQWLGILAHGFTWASVCEFHCRMTAPIFQRGLHARSWHGIRYNDPQYQGALVRLPQGVVSSHIATGKDQVCMLWNFNDCPISGPPGPCRVGRKHVCMTCWGEHKAKDCPEGWKAEKMCGEGEAAVGGMEAPRGCYWWNHGRCAEPCGWGMRHACTICSGTHREPQCPYKKKKTHKF
ncbi:uncharacterized protein LOC62_02G003141 [Vanrija pseudolonga]|uniref:Uncharacterized protein n=1 Tax=Vanrija pseudolonga TaxID=143232 RepID=A0AAF0Y9S9_9TREE|nr:hypothetical protein LOC62_02G003141 [Vanrija pseudolonga]